MASELNTINNEPENPASGLDSDYVHVRKDELALVPGMSGIISPHLSTSWSWRASLGNQITELIIQLLNYHRYRPSDGVGSVYTTFLYKTYFTDDVENNSSEFNGEKENNENVKSKDNEEYASKLAQFGKLGKLIDTQIFEFEQWDEFEAGKLVKLPSIVKDLRTLKRLITEGRELKEIPGTILLGPFLSLIESPDTSGSITATALGCLDQMITLGIVNSHTPALQDALPNFVTALTACRFEAGDASGDEVVLLRIIQLMGTLLSNEGLVRYLTSESIASILEAAISLACQLRLSPVLRYQAEQLLKIMSLKLTQTFLDTTSILVPVFQLVISLLEPHSTQHSNYMRLLGLGILAEILAKNHKAMTSDPQVTDLIFDKLCGYLWMLIDGEHIGIITKALELISNLISAALPELKQQLLLWLQQILQKISSLESSLDSNSYRQTKEDDIIFLLENFLLQLLVDHKQLINELFINFDCCLNQPDMALNLTNFLVDSATRARNRTNNTKKYTINIWQDQILKILVELLKEAKIQPKNDVLLKLTDIKKLLQVTNKQRYQPIKFPKENYSTIAVDELSKIQTQKKILRNFVVLFNQKPWSGLDFLIEHGSLPSKDSPDFNHRACKVLLTTVGLDKKVLGEFIAKKQNSELLIAFVNEFNFKEKRIDEAMREFLQAFRLPGESQLIERIFEVFSEVYFLSGPEHIANKDAVFVLAYSIILINTDLHNKQVRKKMEFTEYTKNLRGVNDGKNFNEEFLRAIYNTIKENEIVMAEEQDGRISMEYNWKFITSNPIFKRKYLLCHGGQYDKELFSNIANLLVDYFTKIYSDSMSDQILQSSLQGLYLILLLSNHYGTSEITDYVIRRSILLNSSIFGLDENNTNIENELEFSEEIMSQPRTVPPNRTQQVDGKILSDVSLMLGQSYRSQLLVVFLVNTFNEMPNGLFNGWWDILEILRGFVDSFLLPESLLQLPDFELKPDSSGPCFTNIPFKPSSSSLLKSRISSRRQLSAPVELNRFEESLAASDIVLTDSGSGLFSTLSSYLGYSNQHPDLIWEYSPQILFAYLDSVKKLVPQLDFETMLSSLMKVDDMGFESTLKRIMIIVKNNHSVIKPVSHDPFIEKNEPTNTPVNPKRPGTPGSINSTKTSNTLTSIKKQDRYFPSTAFLFHWIVSSTMRRPNSYSYWPLVISFLGDIFYNAEFYHPYLIRRGVVELSNILLHFHKHNEIGPEDPCCIKVLDILSSLTPNIIEMSSAPLIVMFKTIYSLNQHIFKNVYYFSTCLHTLQVNTNQDDSLIVQESFNLLRILTSNIIYIDIEHPDFLILVNLLAEYSNPDRFIRSSTDAVEPIVERSLLAIQDLSSLVVTATKLYRVDTSEVPSHGSSSRYYIPPLIGLSSLCTHRRKEIGNASFYHLKKCVLSQDLFRSHGESLDDWDLLFRRVLFPLAEKSLEPKPIRRNESESEIESVEENRNRIVSLISSLFLHFVATSIIVTDTFTLDVSNDTYDAFSRLWLEVLDFLLRLVRHPAEPALLLEAIMENLKNLLLVLTSTKILLKFNEIETSEDMRSRTSQYTWNLINEALPNLVKEIFLPSPTLATADKTVVKDSNVLDDKESTQNQNISSEPATTQADNQPPNIVDPSIMDSGLSATVEYPIKTQPETNPMVNISKETAEVINETNIETERSQQENAIPPEIKIEITEDKQESNQQQGELPPSPTALSYGII